MCVLIKDLAVGALLAAPSSGTSSVGLSLSSLLKSFFWVPAPDPDTSGFGTALRTFPVFFHHQKVHYNALFAKIRPQHAL